MMEYGERVTAEDVTPPDDPQYMFLRERLKALKDGSVLGGGERGGGVSG